MQSTAVDSNVINDIRFPFRGSVPAAREISVGPATHISHEPGLLLWFWGTSADVVIVSELKQLVGLTTRT